MLSRRALVKAAGIATLGRVVRPDSVLKTEAACGTDSATCGRSLVFAGRTWDITSGAGDLIGPGPNELSNSSDNVWVDSHGRLHLKITHRGKTWQCAEIALRKPLGYGTYTFTLDSAPVVDTNVVLGMFTYADDEHEIDVELGDFSGEIAPNNAAYTLQRLPGASRNFTSGFTMRRTMHPSRHAFTWSAKSVTFSSVYGSSAQHRVANAKTTLGVPQLDPDNPQRVVINLWLYASDDASRGRPPSDGKEAEAIISDFRFTPPTK